MCREKERDGRGREREKKEGRREERKMKRGKERGSESAAHIPHIHTVGWDCYAGQAVAAGITPSELDKCLRKPVTCSPQVIV